MDEFAESRFRLEARYRHVLVDEFQDTSRAQWELVAQLVRSWGEGLGAAADALLPRSSSSAIASSRSTGFATPTSRCSTRRRRSSADCGPRSDPRRAITVSFRARAGAAGVRERRLRRDRRSARRHAAATRFGTTSATGFRSATLTRLPAGPRRATAAGRTEPARRSGLIVGETVKAAAETRRGGDRPSAVGCDRARPGDRRSPAAQPADIAILFRSRDSHREFEKALERRGVSTYVYKGLGFFEADEIQDAVALLRYLADPLFESARGDAAAIAHRAAVRRGDRAPRARPSPRRCSAPSRRRRRWPGGRRPAGSRSAAPIGAALAVVGRSARRPPKSSTRFSGRPRTRMRLRGSRRRAGAREPQEAARHGRPVSEPRLRDAGARRRSSGSAGRRRRVERRHRRQGCRQPDDGARRERARVPGRVSRQLGRGTGGFRAPIRVAADAEGRPSVAIADYQSEADEDAQARDREENKRLLYVALTRARDRVYLSLTVQEASAAWAAAASARCCRRRCGPCSSSPRPAAVGRQPSRRCVWSGPRWPGAPLSRCPGRPKE